MRDGYLGRYLPDNNNEPRSQAAENRPNPKFGMKFLLAGTDSHGMNGSGISIEIPLQHCIGLHDTGVLSLVFPNEETAERLIEHCVCRLSESSDRNFIGCFDTTIAIEQEYRIECCLPQCVEQMLVSVAMHRSGQREYSECCKQDGDENRGSELKTEC